MVRSWYVKKLVEIEAAYFGGSLEEAKELAVWCGGNVIEEPGDKAGPIKVMIPIDTGGYATLYAGQWLLRGINGGFYPCSEDVFTKTYELSRGE